MPDHPDARRLYEAGRCWGASPRAFSRAPRVKEGAPPPPNVPALRADLDAAVAAAPRQAYLYAWRAETRRRLGDASGALEDCERALRLDPREAVARVCRARLRLARGDARGVVRRGARRPAPRLRGSAARGGARPPGARGRPRGPALARRRLQTRQPLRLAQPRAGGRRTSARPPVGGPGARRRPLGRQAADLDREWRLSQGDASGALALLGEAARLDPARAWAWGFRGEAFAVLGRRRDAEASLTRALKLDARFARGFLARGRLRLDARRAAAAERDFTAALAVDRDLAASASCHDPLAGGDSLWSTAGRQSVFTEADWTDVCASASHRLCLTVKSKTIAERAARDWMAAEGGDMEFVTVNPALVLGPLQSGDFSTSLEAIKKLLEGSLPGRAPVARAARPARRGAPAHGPLRRGGAAGRRRAQGPAVVVRRAARARRGRRLLQPRAPQQRRARRGAARPRRGVGPRPGRYARLAPARRAAQRRRRRGRRGRRPDGRAAPRSGRRVVARRAGRPALRRRAFKRDLGPARRLRARAQTRGLVVGAQGSGAGHVQRRRARPARAGQSRAPGAAFGAGRGLAGGGAARGAPLPRRARGFREGPAPGPGLRVRPRVARAALADARPAEGGPGQRGRLVRARPAPRVRPVLPRRGLVQARPLSRGLPRAREGLSHGPARVLEPAR